MNLARRPIQLALICLVVSGALYARTTLNPIQEVIRRALLLSDNQIAVLQGPALAIPVFLGSIPIGFLLDRGSRARILLLIAVIEAAATLFSAAAQGFWQLFICRCIVGLCVPTSWAAASSLLSDLYPPEQRGRANMLVAAGQVIGASSAFAAGSALLAICHPGLRSWRSVLMLMSIPLALNILLACGIRDAARSERLIRNPSLREVLAELRQLRLTILPLLLGMILVEIADGAVLIWGAPALSRTLRLSPAEIGATLSTALLVGGIGGPILGGLTADVCQRTGGPRRALLLLAALASVSIPASLFPLASELRTAGAALLVLLTAGAAVAVVVTTVITIVVPNELRGLTMTVLSGTSVLLGLGVAPVAVSVLAQWFGGPTAIGDSLAYICAGTSAIATVSFLMALHRISRPA